MGASSYLKKGVPGQHQGKTCERGSTYGVPWLPIIMARKRSMRSSYVRTKMLSDVFARRTGKLSLILQMTEDKQQLSTHQVGSMKVSCVLVALWRGSFSAVRLCVTASRRHDR
jgi:hypothetical protein